MITLVGASGGVGRQVARQALDRGHEVTAVVRDPSRAPASTRVAVVDLSQDGVTELAGALTGSEGVISCLGASSRGDVGVAAAGTRRLLAAMRLAAVDRVIVVSAAPVAGFRARSSTGSGEDLLARVVLSPLLRRVLRSTYADLAAMEAALEASDAAWTAVRPPRLTNGPHTGTYRTARGSNLPHGRSVSRADLAELLLDLLPDLSAVGATVGVAY